MSASGVSRIISCGNSMSRFSNPEAVNLILKFNHPNAHPNLSQSILDGFSSYPLKQMKSVANKIFTPARRMGQILKNSYVPCPKCNKVDWK